MTPEEAEAYQQRAIQGLENLGLEAEADDVADLSATEYVESKGIQIVEQNLKRRMIMPTKEQLQQEIDELREENEGLQSRLDEVLDIVAPPEDEDEEAEDDQGE